MIKCSRDTYFVAAPPPLGSVTKNKNVPISYEKRNITKFVRWLAEIMSLLLDKLHLDKVANSFMMIRERFLM